MTENAEAASSVPWRVFLAELVGTAALVLVGLSLVVLMFGDGSPVAPVIPSEGWRRLITGFLFGTTGALIALSPVGRRSGAHINPDRDACVPTDGQARSGDHRRLHRGAAGWSGSGIAAAPRLGRDGPQRGVRGDAARSWILHRGCPGGGGDHHVRDGHPAGRLSEHSSASSLHSGVVPVSLRRHGVRRVANLRHQHQPGPKPGTGGCLRAMGRLVDLLGRPGHREPRGVPGVQCAGEAHHGREAVPLRQSTTTGCFAGGVRTGRRRAHAEPGTRQLSGGD